MTKWECNGVPFKEGDIARVARKVGDYDPNGMGAGKIWINVWTDSMDSYKDREFTVLEIDYAGAYLDDGDIFNFAFPLSSLENVSYNKVKEEA